ncbi:hypothetical protein HMPREF1576_00134 [Gardnerella pickettii JCP7719]|uniref:Uncharacterized protein n=1 Tax=Gardnerella pickettii JCP7719 TaxID=1261061 RepID=S4IB32_9BIFI|nr:hypothetical protein HMPREF1576_00134 [Gardnerella pickettii JCP7719]
MLLNFLLSTIANIRKGGIKSKNDSSRTAGIIRSLWQFIRNN